MDVATRRETLHKLCKFSNETKKRLLRHSSITKKLKQQDATYCLNTTESNTTDPKYFNDLKDAHSVLGAQISENSGNEQNYRAFENAQHPDYVPSATTMLEETFRLMNEIVTSTCANNKNAATFANNKTEVEVSQNASSITMNGTLSNHRLSPSAFVSNIQRTQPDARKSNGYRLFDNVHMIDCERDDHSVTESQIVDSSICNVNAWMNKLPMSDESTDARADDPSPKSLSWCYTGTPPLERRCNHSDAKPKQANSVRLIKQPHKAYLFASTNMPVVVAAANYVSTPCDSSNNVQSEQVILNNMDPQLGATYFAKTSVNSTSGNDEATHLSVLKSDTTLSEQQGLPYHLNEEEVQLNQMHSNYIRITSPVRYRGKDIDRRSTSPESSESSTVYHNSESEFGGREVDRPVSSHSRPGSGTLRSILKGATTPLKNSLERPTEACADSVLNGKLTGSGPDNAINDCGSTECLNVINTSLSNLSASQDSGRSSSPRKSVRFADYPKAKAVADGSPIVLNIPLTQPVKTDGPVISVIYSKQESHPSTSTHTPGLVSHSRSHRLPSLSAPVHTYVYPPQVDKRQSPVQKSTAGNTNNTAVNSDKVPTNACTLISTTESRKFTDTSQSRTAKLGYADLLVGRAKRQSDTDTFVFANRHSSWAPSINNQILPPHPVHPADKSAVTTPSSSKHLSLASLPANQKNHYSSARLTLGPKSSSALPQLFTSAKLDDITRTLGAVRSNVQTGPCTVRTNFSPSASEAEKLANLTRLTELNYETSLAKPPDTVHLFVRNDSSGNLPDYEGVDHDLSEKLKSRRKLPANTHAIYLKGSDRFPNDPTFPSTTTGYFTNNSTRIPEASLQNSSNRQIFGVSSAPVRSDRTRHDFGGGDLNFGGGAQKMEKGDHFISGLPPIASGRKCSNSRLLQRRPQVTQGVATPLLDHTISEGQNNSFSSTNNFQSNRICPTLKISTSQPMSAPTVRPFGRTLHAYHSSTLERNDDHSPNATQYETAQTLSSYGTQNNPSIDRSYGMPSSEPLTRKRYSGITDDVLSESLAEFIESERACNETANGLLRMAKPRGSIQHPTPVPKPRHKRRSEISSLSFEEARLIKSLDRLNTRLFDILSDRR